MESETTSECKYKIYHNSAIYGVIIDLRMQIDSIHGLSVKAKELILEIARRLNQEWKYEKNTICTRIKEILEDKIREGKITERWIEECLPSEYKRSYVKSELSSQLKKEKRLVRKASATDKPEDKQELESPRELQKILVTTDGTEFPLKGMEKDDETKFDRLNHENKELKDALLQRDRESFSTACKLLEEEIEFSIPRERFDELHRVTAECEKICYVTFGVRNRLFLRAESDVSKRT
jgi:hypothetical protein